MALSFLKNKLLGCALLALFLHGCAAAPTVRAPEEALLKDLCSQYNVDWSWDSVSQVVTLSRGGLKAKAMVGSDLVVVGDDKISLSAPLKRKRGSVIVPGDFKRKVIDPLIQEISRVLKKFQNIVIDPGHGGKDPGAIGRSGLKEKTLVLDIGRRLKSTLEKEGVHVTLTRERDEFISLEDRARLANKLKADLFVSIHANSSHARGVRGLEVYYMRDLDTASLREAHQASNYKEMFRRLSMKQDDSDLERILLGMMYAYKQSESRKLARYLARNLSNGINSNDRGSKSAGFVVLKDTLIPAVLIEVGFLSNKSEEDLLSTSSHRDQIADSLTKSILEYANQ